MHWDKISWTWEEFQENIVCNSRLCKMVKKQKRDAGTSQSPLPQLSDETLSALTNRIESKLRSPNETAPAKNRIAKADAKRTKNGNVKSSSRQEPRGQKRDHQGDVVQTQKAGSQKFEKTGRKDDLDALRAEIIALGGTEDDLALVAELESDSEIESEPSTLKKKRATAEKEDDLKDDVAKLLKGMGVENSRPAATVADEDEEAEIYESDDVSEQEGSDEDNGRTAENNPVFEEKMPTSRGNSRLMVTPQAEWYLIATPSTASERVADSKTTTVVVDQLLLHAKELLDAENEAFQAGQKSASSSQKFYAQVISSGTLSDKISALTLAVQESPVHNVKALETLVGLARKRSRAQAIDVLRALKDLFAQGSLLPSDRRLRTFASQPALLSALSGVKAWPSGQTLPKGLRLQHLILWAYEHWLKDTYFEVIKILETWCNDELDFSKARALSYVYELLKERPEQESNLLRLLVNKLGDRTKKIASRASYLILQLELSHPLMKETIVNAIEGDLLWRPGQTLHAKYYAVVTLNQTVLSTKEEVVASKLLDIYFGLFVTILKPVEASKSQTAKDKDTKSAPTKPQAGKVNLQESDLQEKLTSAVLTGINRAYPYVIAEREKVTKHMDTLFCITHSSNFNTSIQAMLLIQQLTVENQMASDRFYRTLYESLLDPRLVTSSKQSMYLNLLFKSLKADLNLKRVKAFVKRILQIVSLHQPSFVVGCFHLLKELEITFPSLKALVDEPEEHDLEEEHFKDVVEDGETIGDDVAVTESQQVHYDSKKRDPEHSNADRSCLWEILPYLAHYHPSVSVGAESVLNHTKLSGKPDLTLYTLVHFLDRFVYRNPKSTPASSLRGSSVMQPTLAGDKSTSLFGTTSAKRQLPVNNQAFWNKKAEDVAAEDAFFHQYFNTLGKDKISQRKKKDTTGDEDEEVDENSIWKAITESRPDLEGANESDDDLDMADLDSEFEASSDSDLAGLEDMDSDAIPSDDEEGGSGVELVGFDDDGNEDEEQDVVDLDASDSITSAAAASPPQPPPPAQKKKPETSRERKKRLKAMPTFASASDYAAMLEDDDGEDMGM
ncbi:putative ccaat-box-binding transcription factor [Phaeomoniella chlamydospora]|uniref:Putative ccaat-box-binding transcription factor n=1 Tax=Phaeomoniella chlamydospora TaxID=158046 RepID=A0A0G2ETK7_PHACM|nr:putative ccaat-box-binding transcription factor [Phaeomoniella chlamydospora]